jgi:hypothetical protein
LAWVPTQPTQQPSRLVSGIITFSWLPWKNGVRTFQREIARYLDAQKELNEAFAGLYSDAHPDLDLVNQRRRDLKRAHDSYHAALKALLQQKQ